MQVSLKLQFPNFVHPKLLHPLCTVIHGTHTYNLDPHVGIKNKFENFHSLLHLFGAKMCFGALAKCMHTDRCIDASDTIYTFLIVPINLLPKSCADLNSNHPSFG